MSPAHPARSMSTWADACQAPVRSCSIAAGSKERPGRLLSLDSRRCRELAAVAKARGSWRRDGPQPRTSATASMTPARSGTLCASSPDSRTAACRRASCDEAGGVVPVLPLTAVPEWARKMTTPARTATSAAATITGTSGRRKRRGLPGSSRQSQVAEHRRGQVARQHRAQVIDPRRIRAGWRRLPTVGWRRPRLRAGRPGRRPPGRIPGVPGRRLWLRQRSGRG